VLAVLAVMMLRNDPFLVRAFEEAG